jgi:hypothetical protein
MSIARPPADLDASFGLLNEMGDRAKCFRKSSQCCDIELTRIIWLMAFGIRTVRRRCATRAIENVSHSLSYALVATSSFSTRSAFAANVAVTKGGGSWAGKYPRPNSCLLSFAFMHGSCVARQISSSYSLLFLSEHCNRSERSNRIDRRVGNCDQAAPRSAWDSPL